MRFEMKAMVLNKICSLAENKTPLELVDLPEPSPAEKEILVKISACGVCHTELDSVIDTTPVWKPVVEALKNLKSGGRLVINAIRKEDAETHSFRLQKQVIFEAGWLNEISNNRSYC